MTENYSCDVSRSSIEATDLPHYQKGRFGCAGVNRYFILALSLLFLSSMMSSLVAYNATFVAIMDKTTSPLYNSSNSNHTTDWVSSNLAIGDRRLSYGVIEKSLSFAGGFAGSVIATFPVNMLLRKYGAHKVMTVVGVLCTTMVAITPAVMCWSFPAFVVLRLLQGISISNSFPVAGCVVNLWAATSERGLFIAVLSGYVELAALFTMPLSGFLATKVSWNYVFYMHAALCGSLTIIWGLYYRDRPAEHPFVTDDEWHHISYGKRPVVERASAPFRRIVRSMFIWAIWVAVIGNFLVAQFTISFSPLYLSYVLGFPTATAGYLTIAPIAAQLLIKLLTGLASDRLTCLPEVCKLRLFNTIALLGSGIFFVLLSVIRPKGDAIDVMLIVIPVALLGFSSGGYPKCAVLVSQQYSPFVMSIVQVIDALMNILSVNRLRMLTASIGLEFIIVYLCVCSWIIACCSLLTGSFLVPALTKDDTFEQWRVVFIIYATVLTVSNTIFIAFASTTSLLYSLSQEAEKT